MRPQVPDAWATPNDAIVLLLARALPSDEHTLLLRVCLSQGGDARDAWDALRGRVDPVEMLRRGPPDVRRLTPLLYTALREADVPLDPHLLTVLRTAHMREEMRTAQYRRICAQVFACLTDAGLPFMVFRGAALSEQVYPEPALRHSHDLNLLVPAERLDAAIGALRAGECTPRRGGSSDDATILDHRSGLPVVLHTHFFRFTFYRRAWDALWPRRNEGTVAGRAVRVLSVEDALLHACCQSLLSVRLQPFVWAMDAALLVRRHPALRWFEVAAAAEAGRVALPLRLALDYLAERLEVPVPRELRTHLAAAPTAPAERDLALLAARRRGGIRLRSLLRSPVPATVKLTSLRWLLLPSREYLQWSSGTPPTARLAGAYVGRVGRYLARRIAWQFRRSGNGMDSDAPELADSRPPARFR